MTASWINMGPSELAILQRLHEIGTQYLRNGDAAALLEEVIDDAIAVTHADFGGIHLLDVGTQRFRVGAQRGYSEAYLTFVEEQGSEQVASGSALARRTRTVVEDVLTCEGLTEAERSALLGGGTLAFQSTPMFARDGQVLGTSPRTSARPISRPTNNCSASICSCVRRPTS
jgi:GAF domain-containing protein